MRRAFGRPTNRSGAKRLQAPLRLRRLEGRRPPSRERAKRVLSPCAARNPNPVQAGVREGGQAARRAVGCLHAPRDPSVGGPEGITLHQSSEGAANLPRSTDQVLTVGCASTRPVLRTLVRSNSPARRGAGRGAAHTVWSTTSLAAQQGAQLTRPPGEARPSGTRSGRSGGVSIRWRSHLARRVSLQSDVLAHRHIVERLVR